MSSHTDRRLADSPAKYGAQTLPAVIFLDTDGDVLGRVDKEIDPDAMVSLVRAAAHGPLAADAQCMR